MKKLILMIAVAGATTLAAQSTTTTTAASATPVTYTPLAAGSAMPKTDVKMKNAMNGKQVALADVKGSKGTLVIFSCNTCPYVIAQKERIREVLKKAKELGYGTIVINSNEARRDGDDSEKAMKKFGKAEKYSTYVIDENSAMADAFGASRTPEIFLFDASGKLIYHGAIDDNPKDAAAATAHYLNDALDQASKGETVKVSSSRSVGCSIKRKES